MTEHRDKLKTDMGEAPWSEISRHAVLDRVIIVARALDLLTVAEAVAQDDAAQVTGWMENGGLRKPTENEMQAWEKKRDKPFMTLICSPWVLVQEVA